MQIVYQRKKPIKTKRNYMNFYENKVKRKNRKEQNYFFKIDLE